MNQLDSFLRANGEMLQYAAFFGTLLFLGFLEMVAAGYPVPARHRRRWLANFGLTFTNIMVLGILPVSGIAAGIYAQENKLGLLNATSLSPFVSFGLGLLLRSLLSWIIHFLMHKVPLFWRLHRVHHTDMHMDVSTTVRFHPLEFIISTPILVGGIIALGLSPVALMAYEIFDAAMAVITHANIRLPARLERLLQWVLVTPSMHRIHHSSRQPETDSNYGATFSFGDRLFGTYRSKSPEELTAMQIGLEECQDSRANSFRWLLALPLRARLTQEAAKFETSQA